MRVEGEGGSWGGYTPIKKSWAFALCRSTSWLSFHWLTDPPSADTRLCPWSRIPSYGGNFSKKTFKFPTSQTIDKSQRVIELKRELHWKWNRNGLLEVSKGFVGCNAGHSRDNYSSVCWTCIESAQRSKSYSIKLIWRCSKRVQWPNSKISLTKYSSLVSQDLWAIHTSYRQCMESVLYDITWSIERCMAVKPWR